MRIRAGYEITFDCMAPTPMMLMLSVHPSVEKNLETPDTLITSSGVATRSFIDLHGNRCTRLLAPPGPTTLSADFVIRNDGAPDPVLPQARLAPIDECPAATAATPSSRATATTGHQRRTRSRPVRAGASSPGAYDVG